MRSVAIVPEGAGSTARRLIAIYEALFRCYGPQRWWPADGPFEVIVGAILTQSTAWVNVERAIGNLKRSGLLNPEALASLKPGELAELIRPSGYFNQKAKKVLAFVRHLLARHDGELGRLFAPDTAAVRDELLALFGIGPETADSILLYAGGKPIFVVDAYTIRLFARLGFPEADQGYTVLQRLFMDNLPHDPTLFNEYHALIVRHGKYVCRKQPRCDTCLLAADCPFSLEGALRAAS